MTRPLARRTLLRGAGGAALALPLLSAMGDRAWAAPPRRLLVFFHHQGTALASWRPPGGAGPLTLSPILQPLAPWRERLLVLSGVGNQAYARINAGGDAHGTAVISTLTANTSVNPDDRRTGAAGPSIDQELGRRLQGTARLRTLNLSIGLKGKPLFWSGRGQAADREQDPRRAFNRLFGGSAPAPSPTTAPTARERLLGKRALIADAVGASYRDLASRVGAADRELLERHLALVTEAEKAAAKAPGPAPVAAASCRAPSLGVGATTDVELRNLEPQMARAQILNAVAALACDHTRVATLTFTHEDFQNFAWLNADIPAPYENWHAMVHQRGGTRQAAFLRAFTHYSEQLALLLGELADVKEGEGTLLDSTLVVWLSDFGDGSRHVTTELPVVLAGGLRAFGLDGGRHVTFQNRTTNELFTTVLNLFGFDDRAFGLGEPAFNRGALSLG